MDTLISLVTAIGLRSPRVIPTAIAILSIFISRIDKANRIQVADKIKSKLSQVPNSSFIMVWFQRLYLKINKVEKYDEPLCNKVIDDTEKIWDSSWLNNSLKKIIEETPIIESEQLKKVKSKLSKKEIKKITTQKSYYA